MTVIWQHNPLHLTLRHICRRVIAFSVFPAVERHRILLYSKAVLWGYQPVQKASIEQLQPPQKFGIMESLYILSFPVAFPWLGFTITASTKQPKHR